MRAFIKLTLTHLKLYIREPVAFFFTIVYAPLMLILFGSIYGNQPQTIFGGRGTMDVSVPAYVALIIVTVGLMSVPISTANYREAGVLRRFRVTPLSPWVYMAAEILQFYLMSLAGVILLALVGALMYHVRLDGSLLAVWLGYNLSVLSMFAMGYLLAGLSPSARVAQALGMALAFPMMFLSGATIPLQVMPQSIQNLARWIPLTYVVQLIQGLWFGEAWSSLVRPMAVLAGVGLGCALLAARTFRWDAAGA